MSKFTRVDLTTEDLDWFALDSLGFVGHFTSNGTLAVPVEVASSREDLESAFQWFERRPRIPGTSDLSRNVTRWVPYLNVASPERREIYIDASAEWSDRGLYSFNVDNRDGAPSTPYYNVTRPHNPLSVTALPRELQVYLESMRLPVVFSEVDTVTVPFDPDPE